MHHSLETAWAVGAERGMVGHVFKEIVHQHKAPGFNLHVGVAPDVLHLTLTFDLQEEKAETKKAQKTLFF